VPGVLTTAIARFGTGARSVRSLFVAAPFAGYRPTPRRLANLYLNRLEHRWVRTRLWSRPIKLVVEPVNVCNLRCPCCYTGAGGQGRKRSVMSLELYRRLLDELGDYLFELEAYNWGEPLLSPHISTMIAEATARGIATKMNTNFSLPFDAGQAERLVAAGLKTLTVSIDGARQATYEQYRVRGDLHRVLDNCRLIIAAKRRLGSSTPALNWEFHVFPHNVADHEPVRTMAAELGMTLLTFKGVMPGADWDVDRKWSFCIEPKAIPCAGLWSVGVVNSDGGMAPCRGTFYREDDMGALAVRPGELGAATFREVWNGPRYRAARRFFRRREGSAAERALACFDCPATIMYEKWKDHLDAGGTADDFTGWFSTGEAWNYFWNRRPQRSGLHALGGLPYGSAQHSEAAAASPSATAQ
jgi:pyruvate-formate lyase-activating enzyme